jgi:hypothetical protein
MAAGVAYADDRKLPIWVRWLLRALSMAAAGFAARINYLHGSTSSEVVGWGLAAVTMLGPAFFEIRQWVSTLSPDRAEREKTAKAKADAKAKAKHLKSQRNDHKAVARIADRLVSAAPFGTLGWEEAFTAAWKIVHGTDVPGMTPELHAYAVSARSALGEALDGHAPTGDVIRARLLEGFASPLRRSRPVLDNAGSVTPIPTRKDSRSSQVANLMLPSGKKPGRRGPKTPQKPPRRTPGDTPRYTPGARIQMSEAARLASTGTRIPTVNGHHH